MQVFVWQADLLCEDCGEAIRKQLTAEGKAPADPDDENSYDSDDFPKGPYPDGGGESDTPQHCGNGADCVNSADETGIFLENPLTDAGRKYVREKVQEDQGDGEVSSVWADYYGIPYLVSIDPKQAKWVRDAASNHFQVETVFAHGQWWVTVGTKTYAVVDTEDGVDFEAVD